ncbi:Autophagy- protein 9A [Perkinsus olseni]|uniref:Autophagy-related protein 9 n=1 Tax=Perkinsus olseni TaxID=32597 RepID=A0A7J6TR48_PEROL|nr:Autophagy- protein 9A [Perkinsus olseni]
MLPQMEEYGADMPDHTESVNDNGRLIKYVCGSIAGALFALALWDDSPLLHVVFAGKNLLWYLAVSGALVSLVSRSGDDEGRGQTADGECVEVSAQLGSIAASLADQQSSRSNKSGAESKFRVDQNLRDEDRRQTIRPHGLSEGVAILSSSSPTPLTAWAATMKLLQTIHYLPKMTTSSPLGFTVPTDEFSSNPRCRFDFLDNFERCKAAFLSAFYVDRIRIILFELYSIMLCPFLLSIWLPDSVEHLVQFVVENSYEHPTLGHWCVYGCLDESISLGEFEMKEMDATPPRADIPTVQLPKPRVAKAIISFALTYTRLSDEGLVSEADLLEVGLPKAAKLLADIEEFQDRVLKITWNGTTGSARKAD